METPELLLVEDEVLVQELVATQLGDEGFRIVVIGDGTRALAELGADATSFKAVIIDIKLGAGPDAVPASSFQTCPSSQLATAPLNGHRRASRTVW